MCGSRRPSASQLQHLCCCLARPSSLAQAWTSCKGGPALPRHLGIMTSECWLLPCSAWPTIPCLAYIAVATPLHEGFVPLPCRGVAAVHRPSSSHRGMGRCREESCFACRAQHCEECAVPADSSAVLSNSASMKENAPLLQAAPLETSGPQTAAVRHLTYSCRAGHCVHEGF